MSETMTGGDAELYRRVEQVIYCLWDPLSIFDDARSHRAYHAYLPDIFAWVLTGDWERVANYLEWAEEDRTDATPSRARAERCARTLLHWKHFIAANP